MCAKQRPPLLHAPARLSTHLPVHLSHTRLPARCRFLLSIVLWPLFSSIPEIATSPILCLIGGCSISHSLYRIAAPTGWLGWVQAALTLLHAEQQHPGV